jgi:PTS system mannose-specific IIA component
MIGIVVAAHGELAEALVSTAKLVVNNAAEVIPVGIFASDDTASYELRLKAAVAKVKTDQGVLILTDMFGGTPSNVGMTLHQAEQVEVLTGANLPMLIKALQRCPTADNLAQLASEVRHSGARAIAVASEVLAGKLAPVREKTA